ncbi:MAG: TIR domain-containing protein [Pseudomonadota bacterium]|nr:TIR domain-containing protein [Pseudomonadota bacterium]
MAENAVLGRPKTARGARPDDRRRVALRYWAFLSYSHKDTAAADWLHDAIERYRVPPALVGKLTDMGPVPRKLTPIFRDRHELAAADDLGDEIKEALGGSRFLIVLCSPAAARSYWTNAEIDSFKRLHSDGCILAAIVDGEPFASDIPGREDEECFPPALRVRYDRRGRPTDRRAEPMAADLREQGDGRQLGLLKIIAGMLGLGLDDLVQRDSHRRQRRLALITGGAVLGMLVSAGLAAIAIEARDSARDQRREAEGLIGFMLGDLRDKLEPLGRLDTLDSVAAQALAYYEKQDKEDLSDLALAQRSKALTLMGQMAWTRGDLDGAMARYREAMASTAEAAGRTPDNPRALFDHAQNVFWVSYVAWQRGKTDQATAGFREYRRLADGMMALAPGKPEYRLERIYADTNLGTVLLAERRYREAADTYQTSLEVTEDLLATAPSNLDYQEQLSEMLAYLADAREGSGALDDAMALRRRQLNLLPKLWLASEGDVRFKHKELAARRSLSRLFASRGDVGEALEEAGRAAAVLNFLTKTEPANTEWRGIGVRAGFERGELELAASRLGEAAAATREACDASESLFRRDRSVAEWRTTFRHHCLRLRAKLALRSPAPITAMPLAQDALTVARQESDPIERGIAVASAQMVLSEALRAAGQAEAARGALEEALDVWPKGIEESPRELAQRAILLARLGRSSAALDKRLAAMGYRHPDYRRN